MWRSSRFQIQLDDVRFLRQAQDEEDGNDSDGSVDSGSSSGPNFNYILNMPLWCLTKEKVEDLLKQRDLKVLILIISHVIIHTCREFVIMQDLYFCII